MASYDPQRSRRRPVLDDDSPAPVDALLHTTAPADTAPIDVTDVVLEPVHEVVSDERIEGTVTDITERLSERAAQTPDAPPVAPFIPSPAADAGRGRARVLAFVALGATVLAVVILRRRRSARG